MQGWQKCKCHDLNEMYRHTLSPEERARIETLDPFDEYEEFNLMCAHYFLLVTSTSSSIADFLFSRSPAAAGIVAMKMVLGDCVSTGKAGEFIVSLSLPAKRELNAWLLLAVLINKCCCCHTLHPPLLVPLHQLGSFILCCGKLHRF